MLEKIKLQRKINTLELEIEELKGIIKEELYKEFIDNYKTKQKNSCLYKENAKLRKKLKELKGEKNV